MARSYDVIVVGGGPAGLVVAQTAAEHNLKVALVERRKDITKWTRADGITGPHEKELKRERGKSYEVCCDNFYEFDYGGDFFNTG